jgi:hypothetical protein
MEVSEAQRLRAMEDENRRLKQLVADLSLNQEVLKAVIRKNGWSLPGWVLSLLVQMRYAKSALTIVFGALLMLPVTRSAAGESEDLSPKDRAAVATGIARIGQGRPLIFVFTPGHSGLFCDQANTFATHARRLREEHAKVVWLGSHDAQGHSASLRTCQYPRSVDHVEVRQMHIEGAGFNDGGALMVYHYFSVDSDSFAIVILGRDGHIKLRSSKPMAFNRVLKGLRT